VAPRDDEHAAVVVETLAGERTQARLDALVQGGRVQEIEAQLDGGGDLVDVLAAGPGGADEADLEVAVRDLDARNYEQRCLSP
jgi:hypothetical protein